MSDLPVVESASVATCCATPDAATAAACALCRRPVCRNCRHFVNQKQVCGDCLKKITAELDAEKASAGRLLPAVVGGVVAALLCGAGWAALVVATNMVIGYVAVGVGLATGYGVLLGAGKKKSSTLQWVAVFCSLLGLVLGKYFTVVHFVVVQAAKGTHPQTLSYFDPRLIPLFFKVLPDVLSPYDALWAFIALRVAWRVPRPAIVRVTRSRVAA